MKACSHRAGARFRSEALRAVGVFQSPLDSVGSLGTVLPVGKQAAEHVGTVESQRLCSVDPHPCRVR